MLSQKLVEQFYKCVKSLPLNFEQRPEEFGYNNPSLILADAVLSMNRHYNNFVIPRIKLLEKSGISSLESLKNTIKRTGEIGFCKLWNYNHPARVKILDGLVYKFLEIKSSLSIDDDLEALHEWGKTSVVGDYKHFNVAGIGFTTFQYLRMMCGANTAKPDIQITKAVFECTGKNLSSADKVRLLEEVSSLIGIEVKQLDYAIWKHYSDKK